MSKTGPPGEAYAHGAARSSVAHPTACGYRKCLLVWQTRAPLKGSGAIGSAPVSKTGGWGVGAPPALRGTADLSGDPVGFVFSPLCGN